MIDLTTEQRAAVANGDTRVHDAAADETYVLVREDVFERLQTLLSEDAVLATAESIDAIMADDDASDPTLEYYRTKYGGR